MKTIARIFAASVALVGLTAALPHPPSVPACQLQAQIDSDWCLAGEKSLSVKRQDICRMHHAVALAECHAVHPLPHHEPHSTNPTNSTTCERKAKAKFDHCVARQLLAPLPWLPKKPCRKYYEHALAKCHHSVPHFKPHHAHNATSACELHASHRLHRCLSHDLKPSHHCRARYDSTIDKCREAARHPESEPFSFNTTACEQHASAKLEKCNAIPSKSKSRRWHRFMCQNSYRRDLAKCHGTVRPGPYHEHKHPHAPRWVDDDLPAGCDEQLEQARPMVMARCVPPSLNITDTEQKQMKLFVCISETAPQYMQPECSWLMMKEAPGWAKMTGA